MGWFVKWLLRGVMILLVIAALLVSGLRLVMPHIDQYRQQLLSLISTASGTQFQAERLQGSWQNFGPSMVIDNLTVSLADKTTLKIKKVTLALDIWQSLLHANWQFRDLTFWQLHASLQTLPSSHSSSDSGMNAEQIQRLFLQRFDHFILRESTLDFPTPSGQRVTLNMPALTWFNEGKIHRAEGSVNLSSFTGQHGTAQIRVNLQDKRGLLDSGRLWLQVDDIDAKPWIGGWISNNTNLKHAHLSLKLWLSIEQGSLVAGDAVIDKGDAQWQESGKQTHQLQISQLSAQIKRSGQGFALTIPNTAVNIDNVNWPKGAIALYWQPKDSHSWLPSRQAEIRVRATELALERITPLVPLLSPLAPRYAEYWQQVQPQGRIQALALDIPMQQPQHARFAAKWQGVSCQAWQQLPAIQAVQGSVEGQADNGELQLQVGAQRISPQGELAAPLDLQAFSGKFIWDLRQRQRALFGKSVQVQAKSMAAAGDFTYRQLPNQPANLALLAGIDLDDAADAWRYFPLKYMPAGLVDYLTDAIQGGKVHNATLLFSGNPQQFPFKHNQGMFQVSVPLRQAKFEFEPGWPALSPLNIDLNFVNDGLWMKAPALQLGKVAVNQVTADISDYDKELLLINGDVRGQGQDVHHYFTQTPLKSSLGAALDQLQVKGQVAGHLKLTIPLDGKPVEAAGDVNLANNSVTVEPLKSQLTRVSGRLTYRNGFLQSGPLSAHWFGQPVSLLFSTEERSKDFGVNLQVKGDWQLSQLAMLPSTVRRQLTGRLAWQSSAKVSLPHHGEATYQVKLRAIGEDVRGSVPTVLGLHQQRSIPATFDAQGDLRQLQVRGTINGDQQFASRWLLNPRLKLERGVWQSHSQQTPALPNEPVMVVNLPTIDSEKLYAAFQADTEQSASKSSHTAVKSAAVDNRALSELPFTLPDQLEVTTPELTLAGQRWRQLSVRARQPYSQPNLIIEGKEVRAALSIRSSSAWQLHLPYLYYNPNSSSAVPKKDSPQQTAGQQLDFRGWPAIDIDCQACWFAGQNFGQVRGKVRINNHVLRLTEGTIQVGNNHLSVQGEWNNVQGQQRTAVKGQLSTANLGEAARWFGQNVPLRDTPLRLDYDLHWRNRPWQPDITSLSGLLTLNAGKGAFKHVDTGAAGQVLRLFSIDALLRKLSFDFRDTFNSGFYYDRVNATAWIEEGVLSTDNLDIDGLEADIALRGKVNFVERRIDMVATVAPEISVPVGVATAFAINPLVGASVFVASKVLSPLWSKISLLHYSISGPMDTPQVKEVLRK